MPGWRSSTLHKIYYGHEAVYSALRYIKLDKIKTKITHFSQWKGKNVLIRRRGWWCRVAESSMSVALV